MSDCLTDYSGRCGSCEYFSFFVKKNVLKKWGGHCANPNRKNYHDASQKACKEYVESEDKE